MDQQDGNEHVYHILSFPSLSLYVLDVVKYIAGFVVKQLKCRITCEICLNAIQHKQLESTLIRTKNYSDVKQSLIEPSADTYL